ncbi:MAG: class I SAM-dependent methyltransferase [Candidatus Sumerlaeaceae bacterium]
MNQLDGSLSELGIKGRQSHSNPSGIEAATSKLYEDIHPFEDIENSIRVYESTLGIEKSFFKGKQVLDCGFGGTGWATELFARGEAARVVGVDLNREWATRLKARLEAYNSQTLQVQGNVLKLPFADRSFDYVHSYGVMHHTIDWKLGIAEMARVLRPGGTLFVMMYGKYGLVGEAVRLTYRGLGKVVPYNLAAWLVKTTGMMRKPRLSILDAMYVPIEEHLSQDELGAHLDNLNLVSIRFFENSKWKGHAFAHPLLFGPAMNHNVWATKPTA